MPISELDTITLGSVHRLTKYYATYRAQLTDSGGGQGHHCW